jgi:hypothetical protein
MVVPCKLLQTLLKLCDLSKSAVDERDPKNKDGLRPEIQFRVKFNPPSFHEFDRN